MDPEDQTYVFLNTISHLTTQASTMQFVTLKGKGVKKPLKSSQSAHKTVKKQRKEGATEGYDEEQGHYLVPYVTSL